MFRSVLVIILVVILLWIGRTLMQRLQHRPTARATRSRDMVQCEQCKTYIPGDDAVSKDGHHFCSQQHLEDWNRSA